LLTFFALDILFYQTIRTVHGPKCFRCRPGTFQPYK